MQEDEKKNKKDDLRSYRTGPLTVLELMAVIAIIGGLLTWVISRFFTS